MRKIDYAAIVDAVARLCGEGNCILPDDMADALTTARDSEKEPRARNFLAECIENASIAAAESMPICQDTGSAVFFVELGQGATVAGGLLKDAVNDGVRKGYKEHFLRKSIVDDPLYVRKNTTDNTPAIIHLDLVPGDKLKIMFAPKGGGAENMSRLKMLKPSDGEQGVIDFVVETVTAAGGNPCPPTVVGVGIGGNFEKAALLAKRALLRPVGSCNPDERYATLEKKILSAINASGVGAQGLGGDITSFAVHVDFYPCHIASLPVAVNINCHAARHVEVEL